jgi:hypothetical protein
MAVGTLEQLGVPLKRRDILDSLHRMYNKEEIREGTSAKP